MICREIAEKGNTLAVDDDQITLITKTTTRKMSGRESTPKKKKKKWTWRKSEAKKLLAKDIMEGNVTDDMDWKDVFWYWPEFATTTYSCFKSRFESLKASISDAGGRAEFDEAALAHDRKLYPVNEESRWEGSAAESWLKIDVSEGKHENVKPRHLYKTRTAYRQFPLDVFCGHIYQEVQLIKYCNWRNDTNKPKAGE